MKSFGDMVKQAQKVQEQKRTVDAEALQQFHAVRVHLRDDDARAAVTGDESNEGADGAAAEDEHRVALPDLGPGHIVGGDGERLHDRGMIVGQRRRHLDDPIRGHRPVLLHAPRHVDAEDFQLVAEKRRAHRAGAAGAADAERLHHHPVAHGETAAVGHLGDLGKGLVPDDPALGHAVIQVSLEDVKIRAADAHPLHLEHGLARLRLGLRSRARSEAPRSFVE